MIYRRVSHRVGFCCESGAAQSRIKQPMTFLENKNLHSGLSQLNLTLSAEKQSQLIQYLHLLQKWNRAYNLTAITEFDKMISYHLLDSLSIAPYITGNNIVDVGSGAGLPGIPLAVYFPEKQFTLIDSVGKKTQFMQQAVRALALKNVTVVQARAEAYQPAKPFDTMTVRAVGSLERLTQIAVNLLKPGGELLMMKSDASPNECQHARIVMLHVPGVNAKRSLIIVKPSS